MKFKKGDYAVNILINGSAEIIKVLDVKFRKSVAFEEEFICIKDTSEVQSWIPARYMENANTLTKFQRAFYGIADT